MATYQQLPQAGKTNVGTISKHLKDFSLRLKSIKSNPESSFSSSVQDLENFHSGLKETIYHSTVPSVQNAKLFAIKNQYNNIIPCFESIISLNQLIFTQRDNGEDFSVNLEKLNEKYEDHENIHRDICALYELFKEFEFEELRAQEKNNNKEKVKDNERVKEHSKERVIENEAHIEIASKLEGRTKEPKTGEEKNSKTWAWAVLITLLLILSILGIYLIS